MHMYIILGQVIACPGESEKRGQGKSLPWVLSCNKFYFAVNRLFCVKIYPALLYKNSF